MAIVAVCGRDCTLTVGGENYSFHNAQLQIQGNETDITAFGSGLFGDWITCGASGTLTAGCYENIVGVISPGDEVASVLTLGYATPVVVTIAGVVQSLGVDVDAKGIAMQTVTVRLTGDLA